MHANSKMEPCPFSLIRDYILVEVDTSLADLRQSYDDQGLSVPFTDAKRAYIEHLIVHVASKALNHNATSLVTSLPVEALWCFHLFETKSYRRLEQLVIERLNSESPINISGVKHIEHTAIREDEEDEEITQERLQMTKSMYRMFNFEFLECANDLYEEAPIGLNTVAALRLGSSSCTPTDCKHFGRHYDKDRGCSLEENMKSEEIKMLLRSLHVDSIPDDIEPIESVENQAGYRGVNKRKGAKGKTVFSAYICLNGKTYHFWSGNSARSAGRLHAWACKILRDGQNKNELLSNLTENVSDENPCTSQDIHRNDDVDGVEKKRNSKSKKLELVKKITSLRIEDMPQNVSPIESTMNQYGFQGIGAVDKQYWWPKVQLSGKHYWLRPCKTLLDAAKLYAWAYEIIHGREQLLIVQRNAREKCRTQKRVRSEEMTSLKKQKTSKECINEKLSHKEKGSFHTKLKSLVIENLPKHIKNPIPSTRNKSGYKGVNGTNDGKWTVDIYHDGLRAKVGKKFNSAFEAGKMYSWAFEILHGSDNLQKLLRDAQAKSSKKLNKKACVSDEEIVAMLSSLDVKKNSGGYVGLERVKNQWASSIKFKGRRIRLGVFDNALDAGKIYAWGFQIINGEASLRSAYSKQDNSSPAHHHNLVVRSSEPLKIIDDQGCQIVENSEIAQLINQGNSKYLKEGFCGEGKKIRLETNGDFEGRHVVEPSFQKNISMSVSRVVDTGSRDNYSTPQNECQSRQDERHSNKNAMSGEECTVKDEQCRERTILLRVRDEWNGVVDDRCFRAKRSTKVKKLMRSWFKCNGIEPCSSVGLFFKDSFLSFDEKLESFGINDSTVLSVRKRDCDAVNVNTIE